MRDDWRFIFSAKEISQVAESPIITLPFVHSAILQVARLQLTLSRHCFQTYSAAPTWLVPERSILPFAIAGALTTTRLEGPSKPLADSLSPAAESFAAAWTPHLRRRWSPTACPKAS